MELCLRAEPLKDCRPAARAFIRYDRKSVEDLSFEVGKLYSYFRLSRAAVPFFADAIDEFNKEKYCGNDRLSVAIANSFHDIDTSDIAQKGRELTKICFDQLKDNLEAHVRKDKGFYTSTRYICQIFEENGQPIDHCDTLAEEKRLKDLEKEKREEQRKNEKTYHN